MKRFHFLVASHWLRRIEFALLDSEPTCGEAENAETVDPVLDQIWVRFFELEVGGAY